jgi:hypothetical protein
MIILTEEFPIKGEWLISSIQDLKNTVSEEKPMEDERKYLKSRLELIEEVLIPFIRLSLDALIKDHATLKEEERRNRK